MLRDLLPRAGRIRDAIRVLLADVVMPRTVRVAPGDVYHILNRSVGRMHVFREECDFEAFERVMVDARLRQPIRILSYCGSKLCYRLGRWNGRRSGRPASAPL